MSEATLIALDWGTTNVRAALLATDGSVLEERRGESGVGVLDEAGFNDRFTSLVEGWPVVNAVAAGMIGSRQGWREADYLACPVTTDALAAGATIFEACQRKLAILPGLKVVRSQDRDVMRGEETQLAGLLHKVGPFSGTVVMPGTHCKWVTVVDGRVEHFRTYMTGDLFQALADHSVLRHTIGVDPSEETDAFSAMIDELADGGTSVAGHLFGLRARHLLDGADPVSSRQQLSACLIWQEIEAAFHDGMAGDSNAPLTLVGDDRLTNLYTIALERHGRPCVRERGVDLIWPALFQMGADQKIFKGELTA